MEDYQTMNLLTQMACPGNELIADNKGRYSVMVKIPKRTYAQLGMGTSSKVHPAFLVNGQEVDAIYISKYENVIEDGYAYSLPAKIPAVSMNFEEASSACTDKGLGWHLMTKAEWAMIAQWCVSNRFLPRGNCDFGKDICETSYKGVPASTVDGKVNLVMTGTGPAEWSHDRTFAGIWDLKGNLGEWVGGARTVFGELQVLENNNGADSRNSQQASDGEWKAIDGITGEYIIPDGKGTTRNSLKLQYVDSIWKWVISDGVTPTDKFHGCEYKRVLCDERVGDNARRLLQAMGFFWFNDEEEDFTDYFYAHSGAAEKIFGCGGHFRHGSEAGIFCAHGTTDRGDTSPTRGFRSAYVALR